MDDIEDAFIEEFRSYKFEEVFKKYIYDYLSSLTSKISTISRFDTVIKLVNIENIENIGIFLNLLDDKYKSIVKNSMVLSLTDEKKTVAISTLANVAGLFCIKQNDIKFLKEKIDKLELI